MTPYFHVAHIYKRTLPIETLCVLRAVGIQIMEHISYEPFHQVNTYTMKYSLWPFMATSRASQTSKHAKCLINSIVKCIDESDLLGFIWISQFDDYISSRNSQFCFFYRFKSLETKHFVLNSIFSYIFHYDHVTITTTLSHEMQTRSPSNWNILAMSMVFVKYKN